MRELSVKKKTKKKGLVVKPIISKDFNSRCQVDLIDMQSEADGEYRFILNYQDHLTKFTILKPLKNKTADAVAVELIEIFCILGAPIILQSDNGKQIFVINFFYRLISFHKFLSKIFYFFQGENSKMR